MKIINEIFESEKEAEKVSVSAKKEIIQIEENTRKKKLKLLEENKREREEKVSSIIKKLVEKKKKVARNKAKSFKVESDKIIEIAKKRLQRLSNELLKEMKK